MKTSLLAGLLLTSAGLIAQPQASDAPLSPAEDTNLETSFESQAMAFYNACTMPSLENLVADYQSLLNPELRTPETAAKIEAMEQRLKDASFIQSQLVKAKSAENMYFILLYHPITLEDHGRIRIVFKEDGDLLIDDWDFR